MRVPATATQEPGRGARPERGAGRSVGSGVNVMQEVLTILGITADPAALPAA